MRVDKAVLELSRLLVPDDSNMDHRRNVESALYNLVKSIQQSVNREVEEQVETALNRHKLYDDHG